MSTSTVPTWIKAVLALMESYHHYSLYRDLADLPPDEPEPEFRFITLSDLENRPQLFPDFFPTVTAQLISLGPDRVALLDCLYQYGRDRLEGCRAGWARYVRDHEGGAPELAHYLAGKTNFVPCVRRALRSREVVRAISTDPATHPPTF